MTPVSAVDDRGEARGAEPAMDNARRGPVRATIRALRLHQWSKNGLVVIAPALAHRLDEPSVILGVATGAFTFGCMASAGYVVNDLRDREADRAHPTKRHRPFAAGELSVGAGVVLAAGLAIAALGLSAWRLPVGFTAALALYGAVTFGYSAALKRRAILDVLVLAGLYVLRIHAGGLAVGVVVSPWLSAFAMFLFGSLAFSKRYGELRIIEERDRDRPPGRGYEIDDRPIIGQIGVACGAMSVLVLALYVNSDDVALLYARPPLLMLICPFLLYWILRLWLKAHRGVMDDDPLVFTLRDPGSWAIGAASVAIVVLATVVP